MMTTIVTTRSNDKSTIEPSLYATDSTETEAVPSTVDFELENQDATSESNASNPSKRRVNFDQIHIREYSRCLGDNPATTHGPPLSIDWQYNIAGSYDLEEYEQSRPERRVSQQMLIPGSVREDILLKTTDVTKKQMNCVMNEIKAARHRRQLCVAMQEFEDWNLLGEAIVRRLRRLKNGISKKREQELLWEKARITMESKAGKRLESGSDDSSTQSTECETVRPSLSSCATLADPADQ